MEEERSYWDEIRNILGQATDGVQQEYADGGLICDDLVGHRITIDWPETQYVQVGQTIHLSQEMMDQIRNIRDETTIGGWTINNTYDDRLATIENDINSLAHWQYDIDDWKNRLDANMEILLGTLNHMSGQIRNLENRVHDLECKLQMT